MILVDANILMYAAGTPHPHRQPSIDLLEKVAGGAVDGVLDAEVLQEILHRYRAIDRWHDGRRVYDNARQIFTVVFPITVETLDIARALLEKHATVSSRDALHAAVVLANDLEAICSYDRGYDQIPSVHRIEAIES